MKPLSASNCLRIKIKEKVFELPIVRQGTVSAQFYSCSSPLGSFAVHASEMMGRQKGSDVPHTPAGQKLWCVSFLYLSHGGKSGTSQVSSKQGAI